MMGIASISDAIASIRIYKELRNDPSSYLCRMQRHFRYDYALIHLMLTVQIVDAVLDVLGDNRYWISTLTRDVQLYMLAPYLTAPDRVLGIKHGGNYRYGVKHAPTIPLYNARESTWTFYDMGERHNVAGPAVIEYFGGIRVQFYRRGRPYRDAGPFAVSETGFEYNISRVQPQYAYCGIDTVVIDNMHSACVSINQTRSNRFRLYIRGQGTRTHTLTITPTHASICSGARATGFTSNWVDVIEFLRDYMLEYNAPARIQYEFARILQYEAPIRALCPNMPEWA